jgi:hypothetical protein
LIYGLLGATGFASAELQLGDKVETLSKSKTGSLCEFAVLMLFKMIGLKTVSLQFALAKPVAPDKSKSLTLQSF